MAKQRSRITRAHRIAAALATAVAASVATEPAQARQTQQAAVAEVCRYCVASWRAAGIPQHEWDDCTQEALTRLLERLRQSRSADAYRELKRAIWSTAKSYKRRPRPANIDPELLCARDRDTTSTWEQTEWIAQLLQHVSARQRTILTLWLEGLSTGEIAERMGLAPERVSDEKYKALRKLRAALRDAPS